MRVFVTGATGFIGSAIVPELIANGHTVLGLARNDKAAEALKAAGAEVHRGDLEDEASLRAGAEAADAIIHAGFIHDFTRFAEVCAIDRRVIGVMGDAIAGTNKPFVVTSGVALVAGAGIATEADRAAANNPNPRVASELAVDDLAAKGIRACVIRLAPSVHGEGDHHGFISMLTKIARDKGVSVYNNNGNAWCGVHRLDAARLYRLAMEKNETPGARFHGVAEERVPFRDIAEAIGKGTGLPVEAKSPEEAAQHFGWFAHFAGLNIHASSRQTQEQLGWNPTHPALLEDMAAGFYFKP